MKVLLIILRTEFLVFVKENRMLLAKKAVLHVIDISFLVQISKKMEHRAGNGNISAVFHTSQSQDADNGCHLLLIMPKVFMTKKTHGFSHRCNYYKKSISFDGLIIPRLISAPIGFFNQMVTDAIAIAGFQQEVEERIGPTCRAIEVLRIVEQHLAFPTEHELPSELPKRHEYIDQSFQSA